MAENNVSILEQVFRVIEAEFLQAKIDKKDTVNLTIPERYKVSQCSTMEYFISIPGDDRYIKVKESKEFHNHIHTTIMLIDGRKNVEKRMFNGKAFKLLPKK